MSTNSTTISISVPTDVLLELLRHMEETGVSRSKICVAALRKYLKIK